MHASVCAAVVHLAALRVELERNLERLASPGLRAGMFDIHLTAAETLLQRRAAAHLRCPKKSCAADCPLYALRP